MKRRAVLLGVLVLAVGLIAGPVWAQETIKVGVVGPRTGTAAATGQAFDEGIKLAVEYVNAKGGVAGRKLQLVSYDDGGDAEKARTFAKRLLEQDKVDVIVGGSTTGETIVALNNKKKPLDDLWEEFKESLRKK